MNAQEIFLNNWQPRGEQNKFRQPVFDEQFNAAIAAAFERGKAEGKKEGYTQALDDVTDKLIESEKPYLSRTILEQIIGITNKLKSENGGTENGKVE